MIGICTSMCPDSINDSNSSNLIIESINTSNITNCTHINRTITQSDGTILQLATVKSYYRSTGADKPELIRPLSILSITMEHLINCILIQNTISNSSSNSTNIDYPHLYSYLTDRFRSIKKDLTIQLQSISNDSNTILTVLTIFQSIIRYYMVSKYLLYNPHHSNTANTANPAAKSTAVYNNVLNSQYLNDTLLTAIEYYQSINNTNTAIDIDSNISIIMDRLYSYAILLRLDQPFIEIQPYISNNNNSNNPYSKLALKLYSAYHTNNYYQYFQLIQLYSNNSNNSNKLFDPIAIIILTELTLSIQLSTLRLMNKVYQKNYWFNINYLFKNIFHSVADSKNYSSNNNNNNNNSDSNTDNNIEYLAIVIKSLCRLPINKSIELDPIQWKFQLAATTAVTTAAPALSLIDQLDNDLIVQNAFNQRQLQFRLDNINQLFNLTLSQLIKGEY